MALKFGSWKRTVKTFGLGVLFVICDEGRLGLNFGWWFGLKYFVLSGNFWSCWSSEMVRNWWLCRLSRQRRVDHSSWDPTAKTKLSKRYRAWMGNSGRGKRGNSSESQRKVLVRCDGTGSPSKCVLPSERRKTQKAIYVQLDFVYTTCLKRGATRGTENRSVIARREWWQRGSPGDFLELKQYPNALWWWRQDSAFVRISALHQRVSLTAGAKKSAVVSGNGMQTAKTKSNLYKPIKWPHWREWWGKLT